MRRNGRISAKFRTRRRFPRNGRISAEFHSQGRSRRNGRISPTEFGTWMIPTKRPNFHRISHSGRFRRNG
ncbi:MAG: hypothetical protein Q8881_03445 [Sweet potato little leaf phytoplasma]|nr:hypothetical protein [Sweet potato little leaf phytoplasma]